MTARVVPAVPAPNWADGIVVLVFPAVAYIATVDLPGWVQMWALTGAVFFGLKWLTFSAAKDGVRLSLGRAVGYWLLWPGMNAKEFFGSKTARRPKVGEWCGAAAKCGLGFALVAVALRGIDSPMRMAAAWMGIGGMVLAAHFGLFHLASLAWRQAGVDARPIMHWPVLATSVGEFWGRCWNRAFRDVAHEWVFRPLIRPLGAAGAMTAVFVVSGLLHDAVISLPARAGLGLPTLYFVIQGCAVLAEHSRVGKWLRLGQGTAGRAICLAVVLCPLPLLFHRPFLERVAIPMFQAMAATL